MFSWQNLPFSEVVFVGGCTIGLLVTDEVTKEGVRFTDDVDLIINVVGYTGWTVFQDQLKSKGFSVHSDDDVICRMRLGELIVDFMPDDKNILGFSNRWYEQALVQAQDYQLSDDLVIRFLTPPYFVATKLEAYKGRGNNDLLASHDAVPQGLAPAPKSCLEKPGSPYVDRRDQTPP